MSLLDFLTAGSGAAVLAAGAAAGAAAAGMAGLAAGAAGVAAAGAAAAAAGAAAGVAGLTGATAVCAEDMAEEATKTAAISVCLNMLRSFKGGKNASPFHRFTALVR